MSFAFPVSPTNGQTHTIASGRTYTWNGEAWTLPNTRTGMPAQLIYTQPGVYPIHIPKHLTLVFYQLWGAGGGGVGGGDTQVHGGGGGAYFEGWLDRDQHPQGLDGFVVVGAGGLGRLNLQAGAGGYSWVGPSSSSWGTAWAYAPGGAGAKTMLGAGGWALGGHHLQPVLVSGIIVPRMWDGGGSRSISEGSHQHAIWGGGAGATLGYAGDVGARGLSMYGGNGGDSAGAPGPTSGMPGEAPGGGGGGGTVSSQAGGDGARGEVRITVFG